MVIVQEKQDTVRTTKTVRLSTDMHMSSELTGKMESSHSIHGRHGSLAGFFDSPRVLSRLKSTHQSQNLINDNTNIIQKSLLCLVVEGYRLLRIIKKKLDKEGLKEKCNNGYGDGSESTRNKI